MKNFKNVTKRGLAMLLALVMIVGAMSLTAFAAEDEKTLPEELLEPAEKGIIEPADKNGQDLIDGVYDALNPTEDPDPDAIHSVGEIIGKDEEGNDVVKGGVLDNANDAVTAGNDAKTEVEGALTVGEGEVAKKVEDFITEQAGIASGALTEATDAAKDAAEAVKAEDQDALDKAQEKAAGAVEKAEIAYNKAQNAFDEVIGNLLNGEDGKISEKTQAAIDAKVVENMKDVPVPGEDATAEEKAEYESKKLSAVNAAKMALAQEKIGEIYGTANETIDEARNALEKAEQALKNAESQLNSTKEAQAKAAAYVKLAEEGNANTTKATEVYDAYDKLDTAKQDAQSKKDAADAKEPEDSTANTPSERIERDSKAFKAGGGLVDDTDFQFQTVVKVAAEKMSEIEGYLEQLETATTDEQKATLWAKIDKAEKAIYEEKTSATVRSPYKFITDRRNNTSFGWRQELKDTVDRLIVNLDAAKAARAEQKAQEAFDASIAGMDNDTALLVVKAFKENPDQYQKVKDAEKEFNEKKQAAADAAQKAADAAAAYEKAQKAVADALAALKNLTNEELLAAQKRLTDANAQLELAKKNKEDAEKKKDEADKAVIESGENLGDIIDEIIGGDDFNGGDEVEIDDEAVPLAAGPVTRAEFVDYLWRHEGEPEAPAPTFADVPADHEFAPAIGWAQSIGLVSGNENGEFEPDELVTVAAVRTILTRFAAYANMTMPELTTLTGEDGEAVLNCDAVLAEFFGEDLSELAA